MESTDFTVTVRSSLFAPLYCCGPETIRACTLQIPLRLREIEPNDYHKDFVPLLQQLSTVRRQFVVHSWARAFHRWCGGTRWAR
jgi:hypothetical protein